MFILLTRSTISTESDQEVDSQGTLILKRVLLITGPPLDEETLKEEGRPGCSIGQVQIKKL